ncbi:hypothetical protein [Aliivibrio salmonicida]|uniref:hypothetical protein n=1 Tax=Aliivibrio salmonicida TaxID=40269 RepID=UPI003D0D4286
MAKTVDWIKQVKHFLKNYDDTVSERKKFCEHRNLSYNSFRTHLGKYKKSDAFKNSLAQKSVGREAQKRSASESIKDDAQSEEKSRHAQIAVTARDSNPNISRSSSNHCSFRKGNTASLVHGKFAKKAFISDAYKELSLAPLSEQIALLKQQFHFISDLGVKKKTHIKNEYEAGRPFKKTTVSSEGKITTEDISEEDALYEVAMQAIVPLTEMIKALSTTEKNMMDSDLKAHAAPSVSRSDQDTLLANLVTVRAQNKWTASDLVAQCVINKVDLPPWLLKELEIELRYAEEEIDESGGLSDKDAEAIRERSLERRGGRAERLAEVRKRNAAIYEGAADLGAEKLTESDIEDAVIVSES